MTLEVPMSVFLAREIGKNDNFLSKHFSKNEGVTVESFFIIKKIDREKELIKYDQLNLCEIAIKMGDSSVHYLSNQFKRVIGLSVSEYKKVMSNEKQHCQDLSEALDDLREKGYTYNFDRNKDWLECKDLCARFQIEELSFSKFYRFDENEDVNDLSIIYVKKGKTVWRVYLYMTAILEIMTYLKSFLLWGVSIRMKNWSMTIKNKISYIKDMISKMDSIVIY